MNSLQARRAGLDPLILSIRGQKVVLDADLASLYGVPTKRLNEQVKRNAERFPSDFVFQLSSEEKADVVANCDHLSRLKFSKTCPYAFTEHGALMAANVLNSPQAVKMSVHVVRAFIKQRELLMAHADVLKKLAQMDAKLMKHDEALRVIWQELQSLVTPASLPPKKEIGFHVRNESQSAEPSQNPKPKIHHPKFFFLQTSAFLLHPFLSRRSREARRRTHHAVAAKHEGRPPILPPLSLETFHLA